MIKEFRKKEYKPVTKAVNRDERYSRFSNFKQQIGSCLENNKHIRSKKKRDMSIGVASRWYRAPEVILV